MSDKKKQDFFTLPASYLMQQLERTDEQIMGSELILQHFFGSEAHEDRYLIPMVVDVLWLNYGIVRMLTPCIEDPTFVEDPSTGEKHYMIDETSLISLQTLVFSRQQANSDLKRLSCSIAMH